MQILQRIYYWIYIIFVVKKQIHCIPFKTVFRFYFCWKKKQDRIVSTKVFQKKSASYEYSNQRSENYL
jgi:hypothetical protein